MNSEAHDAAVDAMRAHAEAEMENQKLRAENASLRAECERLSKFPTGQKLAEVLCEVGIVDSRAVDDPEGYDNYATLEGINRAAKLLREALNPTDAK